MEWTNKINEKCIDCEQTARGEYDVQVRGGAARRHRQYQHNNVLSIEY